MSLISNNFPPLAACAAALLLSALSGASAAEWKRRVGVDHEYTRVSDLDDPWRTTSLEYSQRTRHATLIGRVNDADRFGRFGRQFEADIYPKFGKGTYAYMNYGVSSDSIFPTRRYGAELHRSVGGGFELSAGGRFLDFRPPYVKIYTGSVSKYAGNWLFTFRPYFTRKRAESSRSLHLMARRYFATADSYVSLSAGKGSEAEGLFASSDLDRVDSYGFRLDGRAPFARRFSLKWALDYDREELTRGRIRIARGVSLGLQAGF
jgi:YaiO family outer membrane protein